MDFEEDDVFVTFFLHVSITDGAKSIATNLEHANCLCVTKPAISGWSPHPISSTLADDIITFST